MSLRSVGDMSVGRREAFDLFRRDYEHNDTIESNKQTLKQLCVEAKQLGEQLAHCRSDISTFAFDSCIIICIIIIILSSYHHHHHPAVACLTAVREVLGSNRAVGSCIYRTTTVIYSLGHGLCAPFLQCLGQLSLLPYVGR